MSDTSSDQSLAPRILRRAGNLLTSKGRVIVEELDDSSTPKLQRRLSVGASIKRKLQEVKDASKSLGRSRSLRSNSHPNGDTARSHNGHSRSQSGTFPILPPSTPASRIVPVMQTKRNSLPAHTPNLRSVAECKTHDESSQVDQMPPNLVGDVSVPELLQQGTPLIKVSSKKKQHQKVIFRLDADLGHIVWESKQHNIIPIENIKEIRSGSDARYYREQFQLAKEYEDRWLTIVYILDGNYKTLHLVAATKDVFRMWDITLRKLHAIRQELMSGLGNLEMRQTLWEKQYWKGADAGRDQRLSFEEVEKLCRRLNINSSQEDLLRLFNQADVQQRKYLEFSDFRRFVKLLKGRPEISRLYQKLRNNSGGVFDFGTFERFMCEKQKSSLTTAQLFALFEKYTTAPSVCTPSSPDTEKQLGMLSESASSGPIMTVDSFTSFLLSPDNPAHADQHGKVWHDMTRPLSEYYISSSHNTYLIGHQLVGVSTIEGYIRALLHGCRSVELDIYDGDQEPMIFHGKTFTSKVSLREVCHAIKKYGFVASPYPIIISAEIHTSLPQQDMIADIMTSVFGDALVRAPLEGNLKFDILPSPEDLKGRILLKAKNLNMLRQDSSDSEASMTDPSASSASDSEALQEMQEEKMKLQRSESELVKDLRGELIKARTTVLQRVRSVGKSSASPQKLQSPPSTVIRSPGIMSRRSSETSTVQSSKPKMSFALVALLVYTVGVKCRGINKKEVYAPEHMFSLSENVANRMLKAGMQDLIKHNRTHLVRIYPKGLRLNSTNFGPHRYWSGGCQLVAINWQTFDLGYMINHAMFQRNGRSGYVLKPPALRLLQKDLLSKRTHHFFEATIISAQQLPRPKDASGHEIFDKSVVDPYVEVTIHVPDWTHSSSSEDPTSPMSPGVVQPSSPIVNATAARVISHRTSTVKNNGFNPVWEEKLRIPFDCVGEMKDLIFVRFVVKQEDREGEEPLAVYCASLGSLEHGYRHLPLHDSQLSQYLFSTLFVRINIRDAEVRTP